MRETKPEDRLRGMRVPTDPGLQQQDSFSKALPMTPHSHQGPTNYPPPNADPLGISFGCYSLHQSRLPVLTATKLSDRDFRNIYIDPRTPPPAGSSGADFNAHSKPPSRMNADSTTRLQLGNGLFPQRHRSQSPTVVYRPYVEIAPDTPLIQKMSSSLGRSDEYDIPFSSSPAMAALTASSPPRPAPGRFNPLAPTPQKAPWSPSRVFSSRHQSNAIAGPSDSRTIQRQPESSTQGDKVGQGSSTRASPRGTTVRAERRDDDMSLETVIHTSFGEQLPEVLPESLQLHPPAGPLRDHSVPEMNITSPGQTTSRLHFSPVDPNNSSPFLGVRELVAEKRRRDIVISSLLAPMKGSLPLPKKHQRDDSMERTIIAVSSQPVSIKGTTQPIEEPENPFLSPDDSLEEKATAILFPSILMNQAPSPRLSPQNPKAISPGRHIASLNDLPPFTLRDLVTGTSVPIPPNIPQRSSSQEKMIITMQKAVVGEEMQEESNMADSHASTIISTITTTGYGLPLSLPPQLDGADESDMNDVVSAKPHRLKPGSRIPTANYQRSLSMNGPPSLPNSPLKNTPNLTLSIASNRQAVGNDTSSERRPPLSSTRSQEKRWWQRGFEGLGKADKNTRTFTSTCPKSQWSPRSLRVKKGSVIHPSKDSREVWESLERSEKSCHKGAEKAARTSLRKANSEEMLRRRSIEKLIGEGLKVGGGVRERIGSLAVKAGGIERCIGRKVVLGRAGVDIGDLSSRRSELERAREGDKLLVWHARPGSVPETSGTAPVSGAVCGPRRRLKGQIPMKKQIQIPARKNIGGIIMPTAVAAHLAFPAAASALGIPQGQRHPRLHHVAKSLHNASPSKLPIAPSKSEFKPTSQSLARTPATAKSRFAKANPKWWWVWTVTKYSVTAFHFVEPVFLPTSDVRKRWERGGSTFMDILRFFGAGVFLVSALMGVVLGIKGVRALVLLVSWAWGWSVWAFGR
jgi:hypothetical protein